MWRTHLFSLLSRAWHLALETGSSTVVSVVVFGFLVIILGFGITVWIEWFRGERTLSTFKSALKSWPPYLGAFLALVLAWGLVYAWAVCTTIYRDHQLLVAENETLRRPKPTPTVWFSAPTQTRKPTPQLDGRGKSQSNTIKNGSGNMQGNISGSGNQQNIGNTTVNNAPFGNIGNGTVNNSFVGPPPPHLTFKEEVTTQFIPSAGGEKKMKIHIMTDRPIPGATVGIRLSDPFELDGEVELTRSGISSLDPRIGLARNGIPIPNSMAVIILAPSAFLPGQELVVPIKSKADIHILEVGSIVASMQQP